MDTADRDRRLAANEVLIREVNEQVEKIASRWSSGEPIELVCECADASCSERIHIPVEDYRRVRQNAALFMVVPTHIYPDIERDVGTAGDAMVVEKIGVAREVAEETR